MINEDFNVSRETFSAYVELLEKWNSKINLVSRDEDIWHRHILDSAQLFKFLDPEDKILDVGSGAGFPGIILSIMGIKDVTLVESDVRKTAFLLQAAKLSSNKITILNERIEKLDLTCDILTSRAFASVNDILSLCQNIKIGKNLLLLKGQKIMMEIEEAKDVWNFEYKIHQSVTDNSGWVVEIKYDNSDCKPERRSR